MKRALFAVLVLYVVSSNAAMVARDAAGNSVTLQDQPCVSSPWLKNWKAATMVYQGKTYAACWRMFNDAVIVLDSSGDVTPLPANAFINETKV